MPIIVNAAQDLQPPPKDPSPFEWSVSADVLRDLPAANVLAVLETMHAEVVSDRFNSGGLTAGGASHLVAPLGSRSQTRFRIGDVDITSPSSGEPMLFPELAFWNGIDIATGLLPAQVSAPSLAIGLDPARPAARWSGTAETSFSRPALVSGGSSSRPPPVAQLHDWTAGTVLFSGPVGQRGGVVLGGALSDSDTVAGPRLDAAGERAQSAFVHYILSSSRGRTLRTLGWLQSVHAPSPHATSSQPLVVRDSAIHVQSTLQSEVRNSRRWRVSGGFTERRRAEDAARSARVHERLVDGPIPASIGSGDTMERRWSLAAGIEPAHHGRHETSLSVEYSAAAAHASPTAAAVIGERVNGIPARVWMYASTGLESRRHARAVSAFATDRFALSPSLTLDAGLSYELVSGAANGAANGIVWHTLLPNVSARWALGTRAAFTFVTGYRRTANRLTLDLLASGDPAAPSARVFRWDGETPTEAAGPLVARVGPGTGGDASFSTIDPSLERPHTDEFAIALESRPSRQSLLRVAGIARRESSLVNVVNVGAPADAYRMFQIPDANADLAGASDDQLLSVYERLPATFGADRYVLTNPHQCAATMGTVAITARVATGRLFMLAGATASASIGQGTSRGFRAIENDQDAIGEIFGTPNAATNARGRLFSDRAYVIKWTTVYRFPSDIRLGAIARYQDGQPFSRLVVVPGLAQGADMVQAFSRGQSRFGLTGTLDVRLQKGFRLGSRRVVDVIADVYNLPGMHKEVEEYVVTGDRFRTPTAVQPPRAVHLGFRMSF